MDTLRRLRHAAHRAEADGRASVVVAPNEIIELASLVEQLRRETRILHGQLRLKPAKEAAAP